MAQKICKIKDCNEEHHAKGYCNRHYKKLAKYADPLAGRFHVNRGTRTRAADPQKPDPLQIPWEPEREPVKRRSSQGNFNFLLNQKSIERLFNDVAKALHEPLYKVANGHNVIYMLRLAVLMAGYDQKNNNFLVDFITELEHHAELKDRKKFMDMLENWSKHYENYEQPAKTVTQLSLFAAIK